MNREYYSNYWNPDRLQIRYLFGETKERGTVNDIIPFIVGAIISCLPVSVCAILFAWRISNKNEEAEEQ